jgi:hypothetical protein
VPQAQECTQTDIANITVTAIDHCIELGINLLSLFSAHACNLLSVSQPSRGEKTPLGLRLELRLNRTLDPLRLGRASPAALDLTILADQELLKVPLDALQAHEARLLLLHPLPHGLRAVTVDLGFAEDFVGDFVAEDAEVLDLFVGARVLAAELVAGEGEDFEVVGVGGFDVCGWSVSESFVDMVLLCVMVKVE